MLSDNSIVYILYTLFLIIIIPIFLRICASTFTGGDVEAKSPIQNIVQNAAHNEQLDKILDFVLGTILMGMLIVYLIIWPPVLLDVPEYLSGTGEAVTGTITEFTDKIRPVEGEWALVSEKIQDENTKKIVSIKKTYFPYVQVGDQVTVSYLRHCKMGMVQEVNGKPYALERRANKAFYIIIMILLDLYFINLMSMK